MYSSLPRQQTLFNGSSLNQLVDHHFLRFRTTTQVIREFLRRSLANRKEIVRQFGSLDPSAARGAVFKLLNRKFVGKEWNESRQVKTLRKRLMTKHSPERSPIDSSQSVEQTKTIVRDQVVRAVHHFFFICKVVQLIHQGERGAGV